jgi:monoamine oxidase
VDHLYASLKQRGDRFISHLNFPVGKIEYNRKTTTQAYVDLQPRHRKCIELSDSCAVTSQDGERSIACDFVVSAVPLGVLKMAILEGYDDSAISFRPSLPFLKRDAIRAVGFGLLNKAYIQFPSAFWRKEGILDPHQTQFGNASGVNPHHYMFLDIGRTLESSAENPPPILMSLISGREAASCEQLDHEQVIEEILETLRALFSPIGVPNPTAFKVTQWGADRFSRGSYTFLTPGTSDEDFEALQSPVNGNGDSLLLEGSETMRLYFAGEHTTALYPSMAHGAQRKYDKRGNSGIGCYEAPNQ